MVSLCTSNRLAATHNGAFLSDLHSALLQSGDRQHLVDALAAAAGIAVPAASKAIVTAHLVVAAEMAQLLFAGEPRSDEAAPATVYIPPLRQASHGDTP